MSDNGKTIWKYALQIQDHNILEIPSNGKFLSLQMQHGKPMMWFEVNPSEPKTERHFEIIGTGWDNAVFSHHKYLGTFQLGPTPLVFHVYEVLESE